MQLKTLYSIGLFVLVIILLISAVTTKSGFIGDILSSNYGSVGCTKENRVYPSGKVPGSYLGLTQAERANLLKEFIDNNSYLNN